MGNFGPLLTASTALPILFRTFHQFDCRAYHFLATAPWKLWPPMWRWELPPISLIFSPAFRLMSTTTHICHNRPNRWFEKRCKIFQWEREKTVYNVWNIQLEMLRSGIFCKDDNFSTLHQPWQATWLQLRGWVKKSVNASSIWCWTRIEPNFVFRLQSNFARTLPTTGLSMLKQKLDMIVLFILPLAYGLHVLLDARPDIWHQTSACRHLSIRSSEIYAALLREWPI